MVFCRTFLRIRLRLFSRPTFERLFSAGALQRPSPRCLPTLKVARFAPARRVLILCVIMSSLASSTQVLLAVTIISWMWWHPCRVTPRSVLCVSITRCRRRVMTLANRMRSYYESMDKEDKIGIEAFRWARAKVFNYNKTSVGRVIDFGCATR